MSIHDSGGISADCETIEWAEENVQYTVPRKKNDEYLKGTMSEHIKDLLRFLYPDADTIFDFDIPIELLDKELPPVVLDRARKGNPRLADLLFRITLKNGTQQVFVLNLEIEGGKDPDFAYRLFIYYYRILEKYGLPVATIVVYTGDKNQKRPAEYKTSVLDTSVSFQYRTYHILDHSEEELLGMNNIFSHTVVACQKSLLEGKIPEEELGEDRLTLAKSLIALKKYDSDQIKDYMDFLKNYLFIGNPEINSKFDLEIYNLTEGEINMSAIELSKRYAKEEGIQEGFERKNHEVVMNLLSANKFSDEEIASFAGVYLSYVQKVREELKNTVN